MLPIQTDRLFSNFNEKLTIQTSHIATCRKLGKFEEKFERISPTYQTVWAAHVAECGKYLHKQLTNFTPNQHYQIGINSKIAPAMLPPKVNATFYNMVCCPSAVIFMLLNLYAETCHLCTMFQSVALFIQCQQVSNCQIFVILGTYLTLKDRVKQAICGLLC